MLEQAGPDLGLVEVGLIFKVEAPRLIVDWSNIRMVDCMVFAYCVFSDERIKVRLSEGLRSEAHHDWLRFLRAGEAGPQQQLRRTRSHQIRTA